MTALDPAPATTKSARFRRLHEGLFLMPNVWDVASARVLAQRPFLAALGTSSAAVAAAAGLPDGERIGRDAGIAAAVEIVDAVDVPVSVDMEAGFGRTPDEVATAVARVVEAGAVGVNIEDTDPGTGVLRETARQADILVAAREAIDRIEPEAVLNARTDVFWNAVGEPEERMPHALERLARYADAGGDCLFAPGVQHTLSALGDVENGIEALVRACAPVPVNLLASSGLEVPLPTLDRIGVRRISFGSSLYRASLAQLGAVLDEIDATGTTAPVAPADDLPYGRLAELLAGRG